LKKQAKIPAKVSSLKEDRQAFGLLLEKGIDLQQSFQFPLTTFPLSLATPDGNLRQGQKSLLRNYMIDQANAVNDKPSQTARWLFDGMAILRQLKPKETFREFFDSLVKPITPIVMYEPLSIEFINDIYINGSTKSQTREKRGEKVPEHTLKAFIKRCSREKSGLNFSITLKTKTTC